MVWPYLSIPNNKGSKGSMVWFFRILREQGFHGLVLPYLSPYCRRRSHTRITIMVWFFRILREQGFHGLVLPYLSPYCRRRSHTRIMIRTRSIHNHKEKTPTRKQIVGNHRGYLDRRP
jgi:hypothetical protein